MDLGKLMFRRDFSAQERVIHFPQDHKDQIRQAFAHKAASAHRDVAEEQQPVTSKRSAVVIVGMHRSGTSAFSGALGMLGGKMPKRILGATVDNRKGHFEPSEIVVIHDRLLASAGTEWSDWTPMPETWYGSDACREFSDALKQAFEEDFSTTGTPIIKDPRICRFLPVWIDILSDLAIRPDFVIPYRNPSEVALSLRTRNGFSIRHGHLLWLRHVLDAEFGTRGHKRAFIDYQALVNNERDALTAAIGRLGSVFPRQSERAFCEVSEFIDPRLQTARQSFLDLSEVSPANRWLCETFAALNALAVDPNDVTALQALDMIRNSFNEACAIFSPTIARVSPEREREFEHLREAEALAQEAARRAAAERDAARADCEEARACIVALESKLKAGSGSKQAEATTRSVRHSLNDHLLTYHLQTIIQRFSDQESVTSDLDPMRHQDILTRVFQVAASGFFDVSWYQTIYGAMMPAGANPLLHFVEEGSPSGYSPGPKFDVRAYQVDNPDVQGVDIEPFFHYLDYGIAEGRQIRAVL